MQAARRTSEEKLLSSETDASVRQASATHSFESQRAEPTQPEDADPAQNPKLEPECSLPEATQPKAESTSEHWSAQCCLPQHQASAHAAAPEVGFHQASARLLAGLEDLEGGLMPHGTTQVINPLFSQGEEEEGLESEQSAMQPSLPKQTENDGVPDAAEEAQALMWSRATSSCPNEAQSCPEEEEEEGADAPQALDHGQLQAQIQSLHSKLSAQASELQTAEAATEYVQRLLNAVTAENGDLRKKLEQRQPPLLVASELHHSRSSPTGGVKDFGHFAQPAMKGLQALELQPATSQIAAMWASISPSVRRSLLPEYGTGEPYPSRGLQGAESLLSPPASTSETLQDGDSGLPESRLIARSSQLVQRASQLEAGSSTASLTGEATAVPVLIIALNFCATKGPCQNKTIAWGTNP